MGERGGEKFVRADLGQFERVEEGASKTVVWAS
jgi:hypothetical protein